MELRQIRHFLTIVNTGSFSKAALEHGLTQQALSKSIQKLEEDLGVRLFDRDTRMVRPTPFGELLVTYAASVDSELRGFQRALDGLLGRGTDRLTIGAGPAGAGDVVTRAVLETARRRPRLRVTVRAGRYDTLLPSLIRGELDLIVALITGEREIDPLLTHEVLGMEPFAVVAGRNHPLAGCRDIRLADLQNHPWLAGLHLGTAEEVLEEAMHAEGLDPPAPLVQTDCSIFARRALAEGRMVSLLPMNTARMDIESGALVVLDVPALAGLARPLAVFWRRHSTRSADALALIAQLRGAAGKPPPT